MDGIKKVKLNICQRHPSGNEDVYGFEAYSWDDFMIVVLGDASDEDNYTLCEQLQHAFSSSGKTVIIVNNANDLEFYGVEAVED